MLLNEGIEPNELRRVVFKMSIVLFVIFEIIGLALGLHKCLIGLGILIGTICSHMRFRVMGNSLCILLLPNLNKSVIVIRGLLVYIFNQAIALILLRLTLEVNTIFFLSTVLGILVVPGTMVIIGMQRGLHFFASIVKNVSKKNLSKRRCGSGLG